VRFYPVQAFALGRPARAHDSSERTPAVDARVAAARPAGPAAQVTPRSGRAVAATALLALGAFTFVYLLSHRLFIFTEARASILSSFPRVEPERFFLFPRLDWGVSRLTGSATFQLTGSVCGPDADCINAVGALLVAVAVAVLVWHTRQLTRDLATSAVVAIVWCLSPVVLGIVLWQTARYDILAFITTLGASGFWWEVLGRQRQSRAVQVAFIGSSVLLLAVAFNAKELTYFLPGVLVLLAWLRAPEGALRRNLVLTIIPVAYASWFILHALTHVDPAYAAYAAGQPSMLDAGLRLVTATLGLARSYMNLWQGGPTFNQLEQVATVAYIGAFIVVGLAAAVSYRRSGARVGGLRALLPSARRSLGAPLYLAAVLVVTLVVNARSAAPNVYYMAITYWAFLTLVALLLRRIASSLPRPRVAIAGLLVVCLVPPSIGYVAHFTDRSAYRQLMETSERMTDLGAVLRFHLDGRPVDAVAWRTLDTPETAFYVTRFQSEPAGGAAIWPYLMRRNVPWPAWDVLDDGTLEELAAAPDRFSREGQALVVISEDYRLELLVHEGDVLVGPGTRG
jgi:hypothetical protein